MKSLKQRGYPRSSSIKKYKVGDVALCLQCNKKMVVTPYMVRWGKYKCNYCQNRKALDWAKAHPEKKNQTNKRYFSSPLGKLAMSRHGKKFREKYPEKYKAHMLVHTAVRSKKLIPKPCKNCKESKVDGHHPDYSKPLEVIWLCKPCHRKLHMLAEREKNNQ